MGNSAASIGTNKYLQVQTLEGIRCEPNCPNSDATVTEEPPAEAGGRRWTEGQAPDGPMVRTKPAATTKVTNPIRYRKWFCT